MSENHPENKLQIRAKILSSIISMQNNSHDREFIKNTIAELNAIEDKSSVLEILVKEFLKENSEMRDYTISFLIKELVPQDITEKAMFETLASPKIKDDI